MVADNPVRRTLTARAVAEKKGISERTVRRFAAEPRAEFLTRARERRRQAVDLRRQGLKFREVAEAMGVSLGTATRLVHDARRRGEWDGQISN